jgi:hypothetical protein
MMSEDSPRPNNSINDPERIEDLAFEEGDSTAYFMECCVFLDEFLDQRPELAGEEIRQKVRDILAWMCADPADRNAASAQDVAIDLHLFGLVGKSLYFLRNQADAPQFREEVRRLFTDINQVRGNAWLFYMAGIFARAGFAVEFIVELGGQGLKTPDFRATRETLTIYVEANARSKQAANIDDIATLLWDVMHGSGSNGKQLKFVDAQYNPGLIAVDVSRCNVNANSTNLPPFLKLKTDALLAQNSQGFVYDLRKDSEFFKHLDNTGNLVEYAIRYFHAMAQKNLYCVRAILVGMALKIVVQGDTVSAPKGSVLIVDSRYPELAIQNLSRAIYLVDTQNPL